MTDRDRLIELFKAIEKDPAITCPHYKTDKTCDTCKYTINDVICNNTLRTVDYLLANGVIVPPCYIGQTVYQLYEKYNGDLIIRQGKVSAIQQKADKSWKIRITVNHYVFEITPDKIGKTVFLTKEEAEQELKELGKYV